MRLSEAILLGSVGTGQAFGKLNDGQGNTCAYGSALAAEGIQVTIYRAFEIPTIIPLEWAWAFKISSKACCPAEDCNSFDLHSGGPCINIIIGLNDRHKWSRPRIAEWVAQEEVRLGIVSKRIEEVCYAIK